MINKDIRGEIYEYLSLDEKIDIMEINDRILNKKIKEEINDMWMVWLKGQEPLKVIGKNEEEVLWNVFMSNKMNKVLLRWQVQIILSKDFEFMEQDMVYVFDPIYPIEGIEEGKMDGRMEKYRERLLKKMGRSGIIEYMKVLVSCREYVGGKYIKIGRVRGAEMI